MLYLGDDWAEDHLDIVLQNQAGKRLAKARLDEGTPGVTRLHDLVAQHNDDGGNSEVVVGIETDCEPWVLALIAAGYQIFAINPLQVTRYRERSTVSGAKSDAGDAQMLAGMVRTDSHQLRPMAGDSDLVEAIKVVARSHKTLITEQTCHALRLRQAFSLLVQPLPYARSVSLPRFGGVIVCDGLKELFQARVGYAGADQSLFESFSILGGCSDALGEIRTADGVIRSGQISV